MCDGKSNAVVYCTDGALFLPTLVGADNAVTAPGADAYDVIVFAEKGCLPTGFDDWHSARGRPFEVIETAFPCVLPAGARMKGGYPLAVAFKLMAADLLGSRYRRVLYLDSDTEIRASIAPLFDLDLSGYAFAGVDCLPVQFPDENGAVRSPRPAMLRRRAGLPTGEALSNFANTGVLLIDAPTWQGRSVGRDAVGFLAAHHALCRHNDEDALNAVVSGQFCRLSPKWNYMVRHMSPIASRVDPAIVHYSGDEKPWIAETWSGDPAVAARYRRFLAATPWPAPLQRPSRRKKSGAKRLGVAVEEAFRSVRLAIRRAAGRPDRRVRKTPDYVDRCLRAWLTNTSFADVVQGLVAPFE